MVSERTWFRHAEHRADDRARRKRERNADRVLVETYLQECVVPGAGSPKRRRLDHASSDFQDPADEQDDVDPIDEQGGADTVTDKQDGVDLAGELSGADLADEQDGFGGADAFNEIDGMDPDSVGPTDDDCCLDNEDTHGPAIGLWPYTCSKICH